MAHFEIRWREVYEMKAVIEADTYEEALTKGTTLMDSAPSLDFFEDWKSDEAITYTDVDGARVETELADKHGFLCLPAPNGTKDEKDQ
jgi:hypothetical protein